MEPIAVELALLQVLLDIGFVFDLDFRINFRFDFSFDLSSKAQDSDSVTIIATKA